MKLSPQEKRVTDLLLQGCSNPEIAKELHMALSTVKSHFNRLFMKCRIDGGIKRVKLAMMLYRQSQ